jgi:hypothetical protein
MAKQKSEGRVTKATAVREALKEGVENPQEGVAYIKEKFKIDITAQQFSTYKSIEKSKKAGGNKKRGRGRGGRPASGTASTDGKQASTDPVELARQVKSLVKAYGAPAVSGMLAVLAD